MSNEIPYITIYYSDGTVETRPMTPEEIAGAFPDGLEIADDASEPS